VGVVVFDKEKPSRAAEQVRRLAAEGKLVRHFADAPDDERRRLRAGAVEIVWPLVFLRVTRPVERRRGHYQCAAGVEWLAPDCLDRFHDDVEATLYHLFAYADAPIENLEGWLTSRIRQATVDGHRRRRGERGAPQRPRVPAWLVDALEADAWLVKLATAILDWVGTDTTAGASLWPLTAWTDQRGIVTGDHTAGESVVAAEIEVVLAAMRRRPAWYDKYVEGPLGRKQAPVWFLPRGVDGGHAEPEQLAPVAPYERDESLLQELAALAIDVITHRVNRGEDPCQVAAEVLAVVFGSPPPASQDLDRLPGDETAGTGLAADLIGDPQRLDCIVATVVELLNERNRR
jgi:hypothetical protein